jgi:hypothetical protein
MHTLRSIVRRGTMLSTTAALVVATIVPAASVFADALNPLTNRSLTLSSSAPGWDKTDGSGNSTYAQPNSGANGFKTGNTFAFNVSTDSSVSNAVKAFTFQYCTTSAGNCTSPGDDASATVPGTDDASHADLNVATSSPSEVSSFSTIIDGTTGAVKLVPNRDNSQGNFVVLQKDAGAGAWTQSAGWTMTAGNKENGTGTGKSNNIKLVNTSGSLSLHTGGAVKVIFFGTDSNYITNPGSGAFFVKINDYSDTGATTIIDGGVTVANVMNQSIELQTKVLETMDFSVGTVDPYTLNDTQLTAANPSLSSHGQCDPVLTGLTPTAAANVLQLGDTNAENSLSTTATYSTHSFWRLSSNSSAGATVYYSGETLSNTEGDQIAPMGVTAKAPARGTPQFGLALTNGTIANNASGPYAVDYTKETNSGKGVFENGADNAMAGIDSSVATDVTANGLTGYHAPQLTPLAPETNYDSGAGVVNGGLNQYGAGGLATGPNTKFAFDPNSNLIPTPLASESNQVVDCVTGRVRYVANIAATTPAGIYTTKVNYIAAPQY